MYWVASFEAQWFPEVILGWLTGCGAAWSVCDSLEKKDDTEIELSAYVVGTLGLDLSLGEFGEAFDFWGCGSCK